jgi:subtilisin family serine protease/subtilisin-like proprotein convertase family protein
LIASCGGGGGGSSGPPPSFAVSGTVSGVTAAGLVLQLSSPTGSETKAVAADGGFSFTALVQSGSIFGVTVTSQPANESCAVDNGGGTMPGAMVTNVTVTCSALTVFSIANAAVTNPLVSQQWHLKNIGQTAFADVGGAATMDINVDPAFGLGYTGAGVTVAVVDTGLEIAHEDLSVNVITNGSWNFNTKTTDPTNTIDTDGDHGTSVAGLIAMENNGVGGIGVAPRARLKGFNLLSAANLSEIQFLDSIGASGSAPNSSDVAVFNQSFGVSMTTPILVDPQDESQYAAATTGPSALRGGKGAVYVKAAGNGFFIAGDQTVPSCTGTAVNCVRCATPLTCENANFDPDNTLPYQIVVGAMNASGVKASYSTAGSAIWVSAPGGEFGRNAALGGAAGTVDVQPAMVTTDQSGCTLGLSRKTDTFGTPVENGSFFDDGKAVPPSLVDLNAACNYTNGMNGTSSATPVTTGVIALMLEANPALTWRDVKYILASKAQKIDPAGGIVNVALTGGNYSAEPGWIVNHALPSFSPTPFNYHNWYGFGLVDAGAAVSMAKTYSVNLGTFTNTGFISSPPLNLAIPNLSATGASSMISVPATVQVVEAVQIRVSVTHPDVGELGIELVSPAGTRSVLKNITDGYLDSHDLTDQIFLSNAFYGENPAGTWTIKVVDGFDIKNIVHTGTLTRWAIRVYGH